MGSGDKSVDKVDKLKKDKKEKKSSKDKSEKKDKKRSESDGVHKESKDKKKDKAKQDKLARAAEAHLAAADEDSSSATPDAVVKAASPDPEDAVKPAEELVPFALPLADDKLHKKVYKLIKKGAKLKAINRGVKECEKAIKRCPPKTASNASAVPAGLVIIAGDISPMDVIMHFPVLCEEHNVPYLFVKSRAELGLAACTKRATSVVMLKAEGKKGASEEGAEEYSDAWKELVKAAQKQWTAQVEPWVKGVHPLQIAARS
ncbi:50S ribosomal protein L30e-like protein [Podospora conica]|nr:50S ribosomal protein L30e-like protein [Schizothecium conicum]